MANRAIWDRAFWELLTQSLRVEGTRTIKVTTEQYVELLVLDAEAYFAGSYLPPLPFAEGQPPPLLIGLHVEIKD